MKRVVRRKYASVSFDGSNPSNSENATKSEQELLMKKVERQSASARGQSKPTSTKGRKTVVVDKSLEDSLNVIREFLKVPKDADFGFPTIINKFLELITNYMNLYREHETLKIKFKKMVEQQSRSLQDFAPSWN